MQDKFKRAVKYVLYVVFSSGLYGVILYFVSTWLAGYSLLYAYLGNLVLIIIALASDNATFKVYESVMQSKKHVEELRKSRFLRFQLDAFVSYKTVLYMFYIVILLFSQIINSGLLLINENLMNYISINEYGILLLIAVDLLIGQFTKDREKSKYFKEKIEKYLADNQDE